MVVVTVNLLVGDGKEVGSAAVTVTVTVVVVETRVPGRGHTSIRLGQNKE